MSSTPPPQEKASVRYSAKTGQICGIIGFLWAISGANPDAGHLLRWQFNVLLFVGVFCITMFAYFIGSLVDRAQKTEQSTLPTTVPANESKPKNLNT